MNQNNLTEAIIQQIVQQQYEILNTIGMLQQIEILRLANGEIVVRKNYSNIPAQFISESNAINALQQTLSQEELNRYFPIVYDVCTFHQYVYMEKMDLDLFDMFINMNNQDEQQLQDTVRYFFNQVSKGIQVLHHNNFIHGDIKLENLLIRIPHNQIKICDFGFFTRTENGMVGKKRGTKRYIENRLRLKLQQQPNHQYNGFKFDVFALGITLFESLILEEFQQEAFLRFLPNEQYLFWSKMELKYPKTQNWDNNLRTLFVGMVCPIESERFTIDDVVNSAWLNQPYQQQQQYQSQNNNNTNNNSNNKDDSMDDEEEEQKVNIDFQDKSQVNKKGTDDRGDMQDTNHALQQASYYIKEYVEKEEFNSFLNLDNQRGVKEIPYSALNKANFKSQLTPQELLTIIIKEGDRIASNWKDEGFLNQEDYIFNASFNFPVVKYDTKSNENEMNEENQYDDNNEDEELTEVVENQPLKFTIQIWKIQNNELNYNSWIQFTNLNKDSYLYYHKHINAIQEIIRQY